MPTPSRSVATPALLCSRRFGRLCASLHPRKPRVVNARQGHNTNSWALWALTRRLSAAKFRSGRSAVCRHGQVFGSSGLRVFGSSGLRVFGSSGLRVFWALGQCSPVVGPSTFQSKSQVIMQFKAVGCSVPNAVSPNPSVKGTSCGKPQAAPYVER
jgi:hypothetical protein